MAEELKRPLLPSIVRLKEAGIPVALGYGVGDFAVPYTPNSFDVLRHRRPHRLGRKLQLVQRLRVFPRHRHCGRQ